MIPYYLLLMLIFYSWLPYLTDALVMWRDRPNAVQPGVGNGKECGQTGSRVSFLSSLALPQLRHTKFCEA